MKLNEKNIFLLDGIGAIISTITTGLVLPYFSDWIGLSESILYFLALLASVFALYSLTCFLFIRKTKPSMLLGIIAANSLYSVLSLVILIFSSELTALGRVYFAIEIFIIIRVVCTEIMVFRNASWQKI